MGIDLEDKIMMYCECLSGTKPMRLLQFNLNVEKEKGKKMKKHEEKPKKKQKKSNSQ